MDIIACFNIGSKLKNKINKFNWLKRAYGLGLTMRSISLLIFLSLLSTKIIHFGVLNSGRLNTFFKFFAKNTFFCQSLSFRFTGGVYRYRDSSVIRRPILPFGESMISTNDSMPELNIKKIRNKKIYSIGPTRLRKVWLNHSYNNAEFYLNKYHPAVNYKDGYVVIILYNFGNVPWFEDSSVAEKLFRETLDVLHMICPEKTILVKPHVVTSINTLKKIIKKSNCKKIEITNLHPSVLSRFSDVFIPEFVS